jgi:hypothetical protein
MRSNSAIQEDMSASLITEFRKLMDKHWSFYYDKWPEMKPGKYHRTEIKTVTNIDRVKEVLVKKLGLVPVFFFLVVLFPFKHHPGPYRNIEKGLLLLYHMIQGGPYSDMNDLYTTY